MCQHCAALIKAIDAYLVKADKDLTSSLEDAGFTEAEKTVNDISALEDDITEILENETAYFRRKAKNAVDLKALKKLWPDILSGDNTDKALVKIFTDDFKSNIPNLAVAYIKQIDPALTVRNITARTTAWAESWSKQLAQLMKLETHKEIEKLLTDTLNEGKSVADFTQALMDGGIRSERYRARAVALTETLRAHSVAQQEAITQNPAVETKEWVHTGDYRNVPRENHEAMNGAIVSKNEPFALEGADGMTYYPMYPRDISLPPSESVNCHCIHRGIVNEDILGLSLAERQRLQQEAIEADDEAWLKELDAQNKARAGIEDTINKNKFTFPDKSSIIKWDEDKHPRDDHGRFIGAESTDILCDSYGVPYKYPTLRLPKKEYTKVCSEISTNYGKYEGKRICCHPTFYKDDYHKYYFENHGFGEYNFFKKDDEKHEE